MTNTYKDDATIEEKTLEELRCIRCVLERLLIHLSSSAFVDYQWKSLERIIKQRSRYRMCLPLRGKKEDISLHTIPIYVFKFKDVKSAVEFYKKYYHKDCSLKEDYPKHYDNYKKKYPHKVRGKSLTLEGFEWFDYCFGDVIE